MASAKKKHIFICSGVVFKWPLLLFLWTITPCLVHGQSSVCVENLTKAQKLYDAGKLSVVPGMLLGCMGQFENRSQQITAYRYIIFRYIYTDNMFAAEAAFEQLLRFEKEFEPSNTDPAEFKKLYNSFRTSPIISIGPKLGTNWTFADVQQTFGIHNTDVSPKNYIQRAGFQAGVMSDFYITGALEVSLGLQLTSSQFSSQLDFYGFTSQQMIELQNTLDVPVSLRFYLSDDSRIRPFVEIGAWGTYLLSSSLLPLRSIDNQVVETGNLEGTNISLLGDYSLRNQLNYSLSAGLGLKYKVVGGFLFVMANYAKGMRNQALPNNRYANNELTFRYGYVTDNFTLDRLAVSVGYQVALYKPKKMR